MSSYNYAAPPTAPSYSLFPTGQTSPNAFAPFHQSPRDTHAMYASFGVMPSNQPGSATQSNQSGMGSLKKLVRRK
ncbi:hypothetical protein HGRIS_008516 [Hohenbuehelia grisea]|uniref:Distal-less n=1 Tax=Hohenbuehelia grisea TaxID=104357 RepID=A0ABR3J875_9AGAR